MDFLNNIKELKDFSLKKLLIISSTVLLFLYYFKESYSKEYNNFLLTIDHWANKLNYSEWSSVIIILQRFIGSLSLISLVLYVITAIIYSTIWSRMYNSRFLNSKRKDFMDGVGKLYLSSSISYLNIIGYSEILNGKYIRSDVFKSLGLLSIGIILVYFLAFMISNNDDGWE
ncbi:hypothetical protein D3H35_23085 [Cohnella faecalis]|uniref:Uncharacterized protein n=1 Tax=Cohnella faecalis TaxID=2315694 RepID=A0A398CFR8_9BACL|nr:hypothetical protein D3H35_23085 [Cohnella faecalis]